LLQIKIYMENYYNILSVNENATAEDIKKSYRRLSMKHHPDRGGNKETFQKINEAYQILGEESKKRVYDIQRKNPFGNLFSEGGVSTNIGEMGDMGGLFKMFFGGGGMPNMGEPNVQIFRNGIPLNINRKPPPIIKTINIDLKQAYSGLNYPLEVERWIKESGTRKVEKEKLYVTIPKGIDDGEIIILKNKGNVINDDVYGDIKLHIKVLNKTIYVRDGLDLLINKEITLKEALLGFIFEIEHLSGKSYKLNNMNGTIIRPYYKKTIEGLGMLRDTANKKNLKGNLIICFNVVFPTSLTDNQKEKLKDIL